MTDYVAIINRFAPEGAFGDMDCVIRRGRRATAKASATAAPPRSNASCHSWRCRSNRWRLPASPKT
ncbi:MAG: hypothetical protein P8Y53_20675 [Pseudolabrys sp.]